jgi:putative nucleotidyltransferase with HDIG domain
MFASSFAVAGGVLAVLGAFWLISEPRHNTDLGWMALAAVICGVGSAFIAGVLGIAAARLFGVTTFGQFGRLSQPSHPLLQRLQDEAPGTYHHSMMVASLAERAASRIGANSLLARVGALYHDVGKLARPAYYIENQFDDSTANPHEGLTPQESAAAIREHVTRGLEIARQHRLPAVVRDFIPEHHGTRLVTYFYREAVQAGEKVDPAAFRYAGPRPHSRETAIVMLADSCEAIVRASQATGRPDIDELVDGVFAERLAEGQLDEADITMRDLQQVAASFKETLRAVYHPRIPYPSPAPEELARIASS